GIGLEMLNDARGVLLDLLLDKNGSTVVDEMTCLYRKRLGDAHTGGGEQDIQRLFLAAACLDELRDRIGLERRTSLLCLFNDRQIHRLGTPRPLVDRLSILPPQRLYNLLHELDVLVDSPWAESC